MPIAPPRYKTLLLRLIAAQACHYLIVSIDLTLTGVVGMLLAPTPALMTLPLSLIVVVGAAGALLAGHAAARVGYRPVMMIGALTAVLGGLLAAAAVVQGSFALFCVGTALTGGYRAVGGFLRFIASEHSPPADRERSLAWVMYGGIVAAALGPLAALAASEAVLQPYVGSCLLVAVLGVVALLLAMGLPRSPSLPRAAHVAAVPGSHAIRVGDSIRNSYFLQAVLVLAGSGLVMTLVMAAGPVASHHAGHSPGTGATMIQWHLVAMFAPSAASALLLRKAGSLAAIVVGSALLCGGAVAGMVSGSGAAMTVTLALVGVGWNVLFVAGSALLVRSHPQGRGAKLQGFADGATAAVSAAGSFAAAGLLRGLGWGGVNAVALGASILVLFLLLPLWRSTRSSSAFVPPGLASAPAGMDDSVPGLPRAGASAP